MISDQDIERATKAGESFRPAIIACKYDPENDRVELATEWCTISIERKFIDELRDVSTDAMKNIYASQYGIHVDDVDVDINAAGFLVYIGRRLADEAENSI
jgi:hypothetical protein